jgi:hypothetical protein
VDLWGEHGAGLDQDLRALKAASRAQLNGAKLDSGINQAEPRTPAVVHSGFTTVGSVALLEGDETTVTRIDNGFGIVNSNLPTITTRFIQAFGDDYDQIAVFLTFNDRASASSLAYQMPVRNDTRGLGIPVFDNTAVFGSAGRMQTVLNMKRIALYGRGAADDPDSGLYAVWAQEAAHRWLVYFRIRREAETAPSTALLGRMLAHWKNNVQADGSILDGYAWKDNGDGSFTPTGRGIRYGALDQYGMGLRTASEVPPFFLLESVTDMQGRPVTMGFVSSGRYLARRVDLTIDDIIRANGPREPDRDPAAEDLRMGVLLLGAPGVSTAQFIGEAFQIDNTRRLWTDFYNAAGGGRGKVCTELLRPCRGDSYEFSDLEIVESSAIRVKDGAATRGEAVTLKLEVSNVGDAPGRPDVVLDSKGLLTMSPGTVQSEMLAPGQSVVLSVPGRLNLEASCGRPATIEVQAPGSKGRSRGFFQVVLGLQPRQVESFDDGTAPGWLVNPDGADVGSRGRWALGTPQRSLEFDYTLQPGAAFSGSGAFVTGLSTDQLDNVEGKTTLESAPFAVKDLREPHLSYQVYFVSADFAQELLVPAPSGSMRVEASLDGDGWVEVDRVVGMATGWQRRLARLSAALGARLQSGSQVRFRFVVEEATTAARPVIEAVLDDVGVFAESDGCDPAAPVSEEAPPVPPPGSAEAGEGCSCTLGQGRKPAWAMGGGVAVVLLLPGIWLVGARRRALRGRARFTCTCTCPCTADVHGIREPCSSHVHVPVHGGRARDP